MSKIYKHKGNEMQKSTFGINSRAGDTIVEVLITITLVAAVLIGAFWSTSRSSKDVRNSEEHSQALQLLQGQVELLRAAVSATDGFNSGSAPFCFNGSSKVGSSDPACNNIQSRYDVNIVRTIDGSGSGNTSTYLFTVKWDAVTGNTGKIQLSYKI